MNSLSGTLTPFIAHYCESALIRLIRVNCLVFLLVKFVADISVQLATVLIKVIRIALLEGFAAMNIY